MTETNGAEPVEVGAETAEADAVEQAQSDLGPGAAALDALPEGVNEADAVEQAQGDPAGAAPSQVRSIPDDVPVADALEQAYEVDLDDDYRG
jgi:hypothetical protein